MTSTTTVSVKYKADVTAYAAVQEHYRILGAIVERVLKRATRDLGMEAIIQVRTKELPSFAEKTIRKQDKYRDPVNSMTDLCGARVITESTNDIGPVCTFIRKHFEIDEPNSEDTLARLGVGEFGYRSVHFIVALKPDEFQDEIAAVAQSDSIAAAIIPALFERRTPTGGVGTELVPGPRFRMEIQVRSLLQHVWANLFHDRVYKGALNLPLSLRRELMRIAAILEEADESFAEAIRTVDGYREYYGTYLPRERLEEELEKLRQVRAFDPDNLKLALKIARIAVALERWPDVKDVLGGFVTQWESSKSGALDAAMAQEQAATNSSELRRARAALEELRDTRAASLLLDYGTALWRLGDKVQSRRCLAWAARLDLGSADALIVLADTYDEEIPAGFRRALTLYGQAFEVNPLEPRAVRGYLQLTAERDRNLEFVPPMRPTLHTVIQRCRERATLGIYLPWAYFDIGYFSLLLGDIYQGLEAYAKAVELSHSDHPIDASLVRAGRLCEALDGKGSTEWSLLSRFLRIAKVAKRYRLAEAVVAAIRDKEKDLPKLGQDAQEAERARIAALQARVQVLRGEADAVRSEVAPLVRSDKCPELGKRVVIVAGGCAPEEAQRLQDYAPLLNLVFQDYAGTIFSGGTCSGIGQLVGDLPAASRGPILKVTCLPEALPIYHQRHPAYRFYTHPGQTFSALGVVQVWADILSRGIDPSTVRVIGISGGKLSGFEYRLGLMMGAKVGIVQGSGRAADVVLEDPDWMGHPSLIPLPNDAQTIRVFALGPSLDGIFPEDQREEVAQMEHERNVEKRKRESVVDNLPENQPWDTLRPDLKDSIRERVDFIAEQLRAVGLGIVRQGEVRPGVSPVEHFTQEQVDIMAEMEHGRWYVQKSLSGWRWGPKKDEQLRTHPDLVAWQRLADKEREKDRHFARQIPSVLQERGYVIVPAEPAGGASGH